MTRDSPEPSSTVRNGFPFVISLVGGAILGLSGVWALIVPSSFFEALATFEPYNQHLIQDIGAFQIGLAAVLVLAALDTPGDALSTGLIGTGIGGAAHVVSHIAGIDLGGTPALDIPILSVLAGLLLAAGFLHRSRSRH